MPPLQLDLTSSFAAHANFMLCSSPCPAHRPWHARGGCLFQHLHPWLRGACMLGRPRGSSYVPWHATTTMGQALPVNLTINKAFHVAHVMVWTSVPCFVSRFELKLVRLIKIAHVLGSFVLPLCMLQQLRLA
eukprot:scaffold119040_cov18-Tisochrysis_lutea.AAC.1